MSNIPPQLTGEVPSPTQDALLAAHGCRCYEFGRLEQLCSTQLATIPGTTVLLGGASATSTANAFTHFVLAHGFLGKFTILGLYFREIEMEPESNSVAEQGRIHEKFLYVEDTILLLLMPIRFSIKKFQLS